MLTRLDVMEGKIDSAKSKMAVSEYLILDLSRKDPYWETGNILAKKFP